MFFSPPVNKQLADKERVAAALENSQLLEVVNQCLYTRSMWSEEACRSSVLLWHVILIELLKASQSCVTMIIIMWAPWSLLLLFWFFCNSIATLTVPDQEDWLVLIKWELSWKGVKKGNSNRERMWKQNSFLCYVDTERKVIL